MSKVCQWEGCERGCYGEFCLMHKPRKPIKSSGEPIKVRKRYIKHESDKSRQKRQATVIEWFRTNSPDAGDGFWYCYLDGLSEKCWFTMSADQITKYGLEHVTPKVKSRAKKFDVDNLAVACPPCNKMKASWTLEQLKERYPEWEGPLNG